MSNPNRALQIAAQELQLRLIGEIKYGWEQKSVGSTVVSADGARGWLRIQYREKTGKPEKQWTGITESECIGGILKPALIRHIEWEYDGYIWRAHLLTHISHKPCSRTPELREPLLLGREWCQELRTSLERLAQYDTPRTAISQEHITERIHQEFGTDIHTDISEWATIHGDLHWANVTEQECWLLDWEEWGKGPKAMDVTYLYCYSFLEKPIATRIYSRFIDWLDTSDGVICQLYACADLMEQTRKEGAHPDLYPHLEQRASLLLNGLRTV